MWCKSSIYIVVLFLSVQAKYGKDVPLNNGDESSSSSEDDEAEVSFVANSTEVVFLT